MSNITATPAKVAAAKVNLTNNADALAALQTFREAKAAEKAAVEARKAAEATIREALGEAREGIVRGIVAVKVSSLRTRNSNDAGILKAAFPEAYEASLKTTEYDFLTVL